MLSTDQRTKEQAAESWAKLGEPVPEAFLLAGQEDQQKGPEMGVCAHAPTRLAQFQAWGWSQQAIPFWASPDIPGVHPWLSRQYESSLTPYREVRQALTT